MDDMLYKDDFDEKKIEFEMDKCVKSFKKNLSKYSLSFNNINIISNLCIDYHGYNTKLSKLSSICFEDNCFKISLFDKDIKNKVRKVIETSGLNLTTNVNNNNIIVNLPPITEQYKIKVLDLLKKDLEFFKISIRVKRKIFKNSIKFLLKKKKFSEDKSLLLNNKLQFITNKYIKILDNLFINKKNSFCI